MSIFNRFITEKSLLLQITNMEHIFTAMSVKRGNCQLPPLWLRAHLQCKIYWGEIAWLPALVAGLVTLQFFQNCFSRIFVVFPVCFLLFGAVIPLSIKTLSESISLSTSQDTVVWHYYWWRNTFPPNYKRTFCLPLTLLFRHLFFVKLLYLTNCYFITSTIYIF